MRTVVKSITIAVISIMIATTGTVVAGELIGAKDINLTRQLDLSEYLNNGYTVLNEHTWNDHRIVGIIILGKNGVECHACSGTSVAIGAKYDAAQEKWKITNVKKYESGSWGKATGASTFLKLGKDNYGFTSNWGYFSMGSIETGVVIYWLVDNTLGEYNINFDFNSYEDRRLQSMADTDKPFYDLKIEHESTDPVTYKRTRYEKIYAYKNGSYGLDSTNEVVLEDGLK